MFSFIYASINDWVNNREAGDLKRQHGHYDVIVMIIYLLLLISHIFRDGPVLQSTIWNVVYTLLQIYVSLWR